MRKFVTDESFWKLFPDAAIAILAVKNMQEAAELNDAEAAEIKELLNQANTGAKKYLVSETISENPVVAVWRQAYQKFPTKKGARCSIEALLKRVLHGNPVGTIAPTVDITNSISLKYAFPIGAENMAAFEGDIHLGIMKGGEDFLPIGSDKQEPPLAGELAYYDEKGVICRCWNYRDGQRTEVTDSTTAEFIAMECVEPHRIGELQTAVDELAALLTKYVGAEVINKQIITAQNREMMILSDEDEQQLKNAPVVKKEKTLIKTTRNPHLDNFKDVKLDTKIRSYEDGWYTFEDTVFYGEKGGMPSDKGTINGLPVLDLKWQDDVLYHKVDGELSDPVHMEVDLRTRILNTAFQSASHLLDGYYERIGAKGGSIGTNPDNQWYDVITKDLPENHAEEAQKFLNDAILADIPLEISYVKGPEYPDPHYQDLEEVRIIKFGDLNAQPCGTLHVNRTSEIGSFVILDSEKTSRGTRLFIACNYAADDRLKELYESVKEASAAMNAKKHEVASAAKRLADSNRELKKELEEARKKLIVYKAEEIYASEEKVIVLGPEFEAGLRDLSILLSNKDKEKVLMVEGDGKCAISLISPAGNARAYLDELKKSLPVNGGGSPKTVSGRTNAPAKEVLEALKKL